jgi:EpsI family protein
MNVSSLNHSAPLTSNRLVRVIPFFILAALFIVVNFETITLLVKDWFTYSASHGSLMFLVSVFIVWRKRKYFGQIKLQPNIILGIVLAALGCMMLVSGRMSITPSLEKISLIPTLLGLVLLLGGWNYLRALYVPIFYLIFTMSVFDTILSGQLIYFQRIAAYIATNVLNVLGLPVLRTGQTIALPHITLDVATACSGINHILALVGIAIPLAFITQRTRLRKIVLVLEAFFIGILANGLRVTAIGLWTHFNKNAAVHGPLDIFLASFIFGFGLVALFTLSIIQGKVSLKTVVSNSVKRELSQREQSNGRVRPALITAALLLFVTGGYLFLHTTEPVYLNKDQREIPTVIGSWVAEDVYKGGVNSDGIHPDSELRRTYRNPDHGRIHVYVGYFSKQGGERKVFNSEYSSFKSNSNPVNLFQDSNVALTLNHKKSDKGSVYFGYIIDGELVSRPYMAKLAMIKNALLNRKSNAGIVIIETEANVFLESTAQGGSRELDFIKNIVPRIVTNLIDPEKRV